MPPAIRRELVVSEAAVGKHIGNILMKLDLPPAEETHRRVPAVLEFLRGWPQPSWVTFARTRDSVVEALRWILRRFAEGAVPR
ncbi:hypothetical protein GCM10010193_52030 [Kitasatospora atroaurantiaca]